LVHADIHSKDFEGKCVADESDLKEIDQEEPPVKCPRCSQDLVMETRTPLADGDDSS
jgi:DNA-directed RNA polymerase subunit RPC12/RpoP